MGILSLEGTILDFKPRGQVLVGTGWPLKRDRLPGRHGCHGDSVSAGRVKH